MNRETHRQSLAPCSLCFIDSFNHLIDSSSKAGQIQGRYRGGSEDFARIARTVLVLAHQLGLVLGNKVLTQTGSSPRLIPWRNEASSFVPSFSPRVPRCSPDPEDSTAEPHGCNQEHIPRIRLQSRPHGTQAAHHTPYVSD